MAQLAGPLKWSFAETLFPLYHVRIELALQNHLQLMNRSWYSCETWKIDCSTKASKNLEDHGCKPPVTKLASALHTHLQTPQLCSLCTKEFHHDCHMISWSVIIGSRLTPHSLSFVATSEHVMRDVFLTQYWRGRTWSSQPVMCRRNVPKIPFLK